MNVPDGWGVDPRWLAGKACPSCGSALRRVSPFSVSSKRPLDAGSTEVVCERGDGFKATRTVTGYRSRVVGQCPTCGRLVTAAGAVDRDFTRGGAPRGYFVREAPDTWESRRAAIGRCIESCLGAAPGRVTGAAPAPPSQPSLFDGFPQAGAQDGGGAGRVPAKNA